VDRGRGALEARGADKGGGLVKGGGFKGGCFMGGGGVGRGHEELHLALVPLASCSGTRISTPAPRP